MLILAVDSSSDRLKIGIADESRTAATYDGPVDRSHAEKIIVALDNAMRSADIEPSMLDCLAVASGPGSFTGLRVGIATVLGLAQSWGKEIIAASNLTLERIFFDTRGRKPIIVIHCRGDQFYLSENGSQIGILDVKEIISRYPGGQFGGPGTDRLLVQAEQAGVKLTSVTPQSYSGGELAEIFARNYSLFNRLDSVNLDVNYLLKSQPEQKRGERTLEYEITEMTETDLEDVLAIEHGSFVDPWNRENFLTDIADANVITLAVHSVGRCIGYLSCIALDDYGYIANIAVDQHFRSHGIGHALLDELKGRLLAKGLNQIVLDVRITNQAAIRFYERYGFSIITRRKGFYSNPPEDSFTMLMNTGE